MLLWKKRDFGKSPVCRPFGCCALGVRIVGNKKDWWINFTFIKVLPCQKGSAVSKSKRNDFANRSSSNGIVPVRLVLPRLAVLYQDEFNRL